MAFINQSPEYYAASLARNKKPQPLFEQQAEKERSCLKCNQPFLSRGDRICPGCNEQNKRAAKRVDSSGNRTHATDKGAR